MLTLQSHHACPTPRPSRKTFDLSDVVGGAGGLRPGQRVFLRFDGVCVLP